MNRRFSSAHFPYLPIRLELSRRNFLIEAFVDTGFDGGLLVPSDYLPSEEPPREYHPWILADGSRILAPAYSGLVQVADFDPFEVPVTALGSEFLAGGMLIRRYTLVLDHGERIVVEP